MKTKRKKRTTKQNHSKIQISVWRYCRITFILFLCLLPCLLARLLERSTAYMLCCSVPILLAHSHTTRLLCLTHSLTPSPLSLPLSLLLIHGPMLTPADQASKTRQSRLPMNFLWIFVVGCQNWFFERKLSLFSYQLAKNCYLCGNILDWNITDVFRSRVRFPLNDNFSLRWRFFFSCISPQLWWLWHIFCRDRTD